MVFLVWFLYHLAGTGPYRIGTVSCGYCEVIRPRMVALTESHLAISLT